jgi:hypothetical protein
MTKIILLGAGGNAGINFTKCLRMQSLDYHVLGCDTDAYNLLACNSDEKVLLEQMPEEAKVERLNKLIVDHSIDFIHAQPDSEVSFLLKQASNLKAKTFPHQVSTCEDFANKLYCQQTWQEKLKLGCQTSSLDEIKKNPEIFDRLIAGGKAWIRAIRGAGSKAALPITSLKQAVDWANYWIAMRGMSENDFMVSEYLSGPEYAVQTFWVNGELVHSQARQRLVYFFGSIMPSGQSSTPAVAVTVSEQEVYDTAYKSIQAIDPKPHGIYCADLKTHDSGAIIPIEVNYGRFFTTSDFFATIGINTPHAMIDYSMTGRITKAVQTIDEKIYWIRGLDKEPYLHKGELPR